MKHKKGQVVENCIFCGEEIDLEEQFAEIDYSDRTVTVETNYKCVSCDEITTQTHVFKFGECIQDEIE